MRKARGKWLPRISPVYFITTSGAAQTAGNWVMGMFNDLPRSTELFLKQPNLFLHGLLRRRRHRFDRRATGGRVCCSAAAAADSCRAVDAVSYVCPLRGWPRASANRQQRPGRPERLRSRCSSFRLFPLVGADVGGFGITAFIERLIRFIVGSTPTILLSQYRRPLQPAARPGHNCVRVPKCEPGHPGVHQDRQTRRNW